MEVFKTLETLLEQRGAVALLPQYLSDELLDKVCEHCQAFDDRCFNHESRTVRDMKELMNPELDRPYTEVVRFLLIKFMKINDDELNEVILTMTNKLWFAEIDMIKALVYHYLFEQIRRRDKLVIEPLPTINNILNKNKRTTMFKYTPSHLFYLTEEEERDYEFCCDMHFNCYYDDFEMWAKPESILPRTILMGKWIKCLPGRANQLNKSIPKEKK